MEDKSVSLGSPQGSTAFQILARVPNCDPTFDVDYTLAPKSSSPSRYPQLYVGPKVQQLESVPPSYPSRRRSCDLPDLIIISRLAGSSPATFSSPVGLAVPSCRSGMIRCASPELPASLPGATSRARQRPALLLSKHGAGTQGTAPLSAPPPSTMEREAGVSRREPWRLVLVLATLLVGGGRWGGPRSRLGLDG